MSDPEIPPRTEAEQSSDLQRALTVHAQEGLEFRDSGYKAGDPVKIYSRDGTLEEGWLYESSDKKTDTVNIYRFNEETGTGSTRNVPRDAFMEWQGGEIKSNEEGKHNNKDEIEPEVDDGGGKPPTEPPDRDRLATKDDNGGKKDDGDPEIGRYNEKGEYELLVDLDKLSDKLGVPREVIEMAAKHGYSPEFLLMAKENPFASQTLRELGIDWGAQLSDEITEEEEDQILEDPFLVLENKRKDREKIIKKIADQIEENPGAVKKSLSRPGELPVGLHYIPFVGRRIGRLVLATRMNIKERGDRERLALRESVEEDIRQKNPELDPSSFEAMVLDEYHRRLEAGEHKGLGRNYEEGLLRVGLPRIRRNLQDIKGQDEDVRVYRNKMRITNRHEFRGDERESVRRDLAEVIYRVLQKQEALQGLRIHHPEVFIFDPFRKELAEYIDEKSK